MADIDNKFNKLNELLDKEERERKSKKDYQGIDKNKVKKVMMECVPTFRPAEHSFNSNR